jgi:hypothetical protein
MICDRFHNVLCSTWVSGTEEIEQGGHRMSVQLFGIMITIAKATPHQEDSLDRWYPGAEHNTIEQFIETSKQKTYSWMTLL